MNSAKPLRSYELGISSAEIKKNKLMKNDWSMAISAESSICVSPDVVWGEM